MRRIRHLRSSGSGEPGVSGLYALQLRQESAGIASSDGREIYCHKDGHVADIFTPEVVGSLPGVLAIGHTRYSTAGDTVLRNASLFSGLQ